MKAKLYIQNNFPLLTLWGMLFLVIWIQSVPQTESILESTLFTGSLFALALPITMYLSGPLLQRAMKKRRANIFVLQFIGFSFLIGLIFVGLLYLFSFFEQEGFFPKSRYFDMNIPYSMLFVPVSAGVIINACICGIQFFQENTKLKKVLIEYQLQTLQHQVTPHFMFNVLNHIYILMQTDVEKASDLLIKYSEILRYQLYNTEKDKPSVTLEQDLKFLKDFIALEQIRWDDKLTIKSSWIVENPKLKIPALLFVTFIENAFKHVSKSDFEKGYITIDFEQKGGVICLQVTNSKSKLVKRQTDRSGLGLKNIKERLDILYYEKHHLDVIETDSTYQVILTLKN